MTLGIIVLTASVGIGIPPPSSASVSPPPADTVFLEPDSAVSLLLGTASEWRAAVDRARAAEARVRVAGAFLDPQITAAAENLGAQEATTGEPGIQGIEGQILLLLPLRLGGDRGAERSEAEAHLVAARAQADALRADRLLDLVESWSALDRDRLLARVAREEVLYLEAFQSALDAQRATGEASEGEAARAALAYARAVAALAAAEADLARQEVETARLLGLDPAESTVIRDRSCPSLPPDEPGDTLPPPPEAALAQALEDAGMAGIDVARANRIPDLEAQTGLRRSGGNSALWLGVTFSLPVTARTHARVEAAEADADALRVEGEVLRRQVQANLAASRRRLEALESAGRRFDDRWSAALNTSVQATDALFRLGEGTIVELLDSRRARLAAIVDYAAWRAQLLLARAEVIRWSRGDMGPEILCTPEPLERP